MKKLKSFGLKLLLLISLLGAIGMLGAFAHYIVNHWELIKYSLNK